MKREVARFLHRVGNSVVARVTDPGAVPRPGSPLFDMKGRRVGRVVDIIGNVCAPYLVIRGSPSRVYYTDEKFLIRGETNG